MQQARGNIKAKQLCGIPEPIKTIQLKAKPIAIINTDLSAETSAKEEMLTLTSIHFTRSLSTKPEKAIHYLASRKLDYKKLAISYDAGTLHKAKEITNEQKQSYLQTGLLKPDKFGRENSDYTRFNSCIVFPLLDKSGNIITIETITDYKTKRFKR